MQHDRVLPSFNDHDGHSKIEPLTSASLIPPLPFTQYLLESTQAKLGRPAPRSGSSI